MPNSAVRWSLSAFFTVLALSLGAVAQSAQKPLRASQVLALEAGGALQANVAHDVAARGLNFRADEDFVAQLKRVGADATVLAAVKAAKVSADDAKPDKDLLQQLSNADVLIKEKHYYEAATELSKALKASFAGPETGFVMGELLRQQEDFRQAASVYGEVLREDPNFPEVHTKASFVLYKLADFEDALSEAKAALALNPDDAEAHKNAGMALDSEQKFDAAMAEYKEALRIKPDYGNVRFDLGLLLDHRGLYDDAISEYKKAIALDPNFVGAHTNLGVLYKERLGKIGEAIREFREAKRLMPNDPRTRQNLASALMSQSPRDAIVEWRELEKMFPGSEMCHLCLAKELAWTGDLAGAEAEYRKAEELDPSDPEPYTGLGKMRENENNYDAALEQFRVAEKLGPDEGLTHQDVGRILLAEKDVAGALAELKRAEVLSPSSWQIHELYGQALQASGQNDLAIAEFREAGALDPKQSEVILELGLALEKKGDWVSALEQDKKAVQNEFSRISKVQAGEAYRVGTDAQKQYHAAQLRFGDYVASMKAAGKSAEAAELEKRVGMLDTAGGTLEKEQAAIQSGDQAEKERRLEDAEKLYKQAVGLAEQLPPGDDNLSLALGRLGGVYGMRHNFSDAEVLFHRQLIAIEKAFGGTSPRTVDPLRNLGQIAAMTDNFAVAESYFTRALDVNLNAFGENSGQTVESLRALAGLYESRQQWDKAEPFLLRGVKASEVASGEDAPGVPVIP
jgi:tetratricopeptide (TPR) repeat protein